MKVLITGASGFIGSWVVRSAVEAGHDVRVLVRQKSNLTNLLPYLPASEGGQAPAGGRVIERALGDVLEADAVRRAVDGCEGVIHTAGVAHFNPDDPAHMFRVNVEGVETVLRAARAAGVRRAVVTSSVAAIGGGHEPRIADETTPSNAESLGIDYSLSKLRGEQAALRIAQEGLDVRVVRPSVAAGPGDIYNSSATTFLALARRQMPVYVAGGASFGDVREMAKAHVSALDKGRAGEIYIVAGNNLTIAELVERIARMTGVPAPRRVPYALAYPVAAVVEKVAKALGKHADMSRQLVKASGLYTYASSEKAIRELGYRIPPFDESMRDTFRFFLQAGRLKPSTPELRAML